jgi:hypothetical protein
MSMVVNFVSLHREITQAGFGGYSTLVCGPNSGHHAVFSTCKPEKPSPDRRMPVDFQLSSELVCDGSRWTYKYLSTFCVIQ